MRSADAIAADKVNAAIKRGPTRLKLMEALADSELGNGVLLDKLKELETRIEELYNENQKYAGEIGNYARRLENEREKVDSLKDMLRGAHMEIADLNGYIRRVTEDDAVRDTVGTTRQIEEPVAINVRHEHARPRYPAPIDFRPDSPNAMRQAEAREGVSRQPTWRDKHWSKW